MAPVGPSGPGCPYHTLLPDKPALDAADPMCHVYVEEGDILWTSDHGHPWDVVEEQLGGSPLT